MRCLLWVIAWFGSCALVVAGVLTAFFGFLDLQTERDAYRADFARSGDDCGGGMLHLEVETGEPLYCGPPGVRRIRGQEPATNAMTGFTDEQKSEVYTLARDLGSDGLSEPEQDRIQALIDKHAATVPPGNRFRTANRWWWDIPQAWYGVAMAAAGVTGILILRRIA